MTREEHIIWCKKRAVEEMDYYGVPSKGVISIMSDMRKHPDTANHPGCTLGAMLMMAGKLKTRQEVMDFINGFN